MALGNKIFEVDLRLGSITDKITSTIPTIIGNMNTNNTPLGKYYIFNGSNYIYYDNVQSRPTGKVTLECLLELTNISNAERSLIGGYAAGSTTSKGGLCIGQGSGGVIALYRYGTANYNSVTVVSSPKKYYKYHIVVTFDGTTNSNGIKIYVNSILVSQVTSTTTEIDWGTYKFGVGSDSGGLKKGQTNVYFARMYSEVATQIDVTKLFNNAFKEIGQLTYQKRLLSLPKPTELKQSGLIAKYSMQPVGNVLHDISGNGNNATVSTGLTTLRDGIRFYGKGNVTIATTTNVLKETECTVNFRIQPKDITTTAQRLIRSIGSNTNRFYFYVNGTGISIIRGDNVAVIISNIFTSTNSSYNITWYWKSAGYIMKVYVNGINVYNGTYSGVTNGGDAPFQLGGSSVETSYNGIVKDVRVYNKELTTQEIKAYHNSFNEVILHEKFEDMAVGSSKLPNGWIKNGGSFVCGEIPKKLQVGEILTNNDLSNWSGSFPNEIPDGWVAFGTHGVNNYVTQSPIGQCRIYTTGAGVGINKTCLTTGRYYKLTFDLLSISGTMGITGLINGVFTPTTITTGTKVMYGEATSSILVFKRGSACDFTIDNIYLEEIYPLNYKVGTKYLRCVTDGIVAMPCKWVNGTTKINLFKVGNTVNDWLFTSTVIGTFNATGQNGYLLRWDTDNKFKLYKITNGVLSAALITSVNTYPPSWYEPTVTRTTSGVFTVYINGVSIGTATDTTFNTSNYNQHSCIANDRITNINIQSQIKA